MAMNRRIQILAAVAGVVLVASVLRTLLASGPETVRQYDASKLDTLIADVSADDEKVAWQAVTDLGRFGVKSAADTLVESMKSDHRPSVRTAAARALGRIEVWETMPDLIRALNDPEIEVRQAANVAITSIIGIDYGFRPDAGPAERRRFINGFLKNYQREHAAFLYWQQRKAEKN
jgi:HEAT repeat protein